MSTIQKKSLVLAGADNFGAAQIISHLESDGWLIQAISTLTRSAVAEAFTADPHAEALVVVMPQPAQEVAFLDVDDSMLEDTMESCIDLIEVVGVGLRHLPNDSAIVVVGNRGYLGGRGGAHYMALSGASAGFVRSTALGGMSRNIRANLVATDIGGRRPVDPAAAAGLTAFLVSPASAFVNAEVLLANRGRSLLLREAGKPHAA